MARYPHSGRGDGRAEYQRLDLEELDEVIQPDQYEQRAGTTTTTPPALDSGTALGTADAKAMVWTTEGLARRIIAAGVEARLSCVDPGKHSPSFAGRKFDHGFLEALPDGVDPWGEYGGLHTCVLAGPMFSRPVRASVGELVERDGFRFADLVPAGGTC
ncbi:MAG TPA: hypothetical protein VFA48_07820 [Gammaproteobacteria bacterium]|nr:hypothetical protein [Gammaproteobacteria bacterium]